MGATDEVGRAAGVAHDRDRALLRTLIEAVPDGLFLKDTESRFILANHVVAERMGAATPEDLIGKTDRDFYPKEQAEEYLAAERAVLTEGRKIVEKLERKSVGGEQRWTLVTKLPVIDDSGAIVGLVGISRDVTEWRRREETLKTERNLLKTLIDLLPYPVYAKDREFRKTMANRADLEFLGCSTEAEVLGKTDFDLLPHEVASSYFADDQAVLTTGEAVMGREDYNAASGRWFLTMKVPLRGEAGDIIGLVGLGQDITEHKRSEALLRRLNRELRAMTRCSEVIARADDELRMVNEVCNLVCEEAGYRMAMVRYVQHDERKSLRPVAWSGFEQGYFDQIDVTWDDSKWGSGPAGTAIKDRTVVVVADVATDERFAPWRELGLARGYRSVVAVPLIAADGSVIGVLGIYADEPAAFTHEALRPLIELADSLAFGIVAIRERTERERAEAELRKERNLLRTLVEVLPDSIYAKDAECRMTMVNPVSMRILGVSSESEALGRTDYEFYPREIADAFYADDRLVISRGEPVIDREEHYYDRKGMKRWLLTSKVPLLDESGRAVGIVGVGRDITVRKASEAKIREQAELLHIASDAILVRDRRGRIRYWNRSAERTFGWTAAEAIGQDADELLHRRWPEEPSDALAVVIERGEWSGDLHCATKEGRTLITQSRWTRVQEEGEGAFSILSVSTDVTQDRAVQSQLLRAQRLESIGTLAGGLAHDLNNVLTPIVSGLESVMPAVADESARRILSMVIDGARRGALVIRQLLGFARGAEVERKPLRLEEVVAEVVAIVRETFPKGIDVAYAVESPLRAVVGDATQLHQVLMNLCINARDAMSGGGVLSVSARNLDLDDAGARTHLEARSGAYVVLAVEDSGSGMEPEIVEQIFDPFFTTKGPRSGTGLGLSTARSIVKAHGGFITVSSEPGRGSLFTVYLPATMPGRNPSFARPLPEPVEGGGALILVVDDEEAVRETTRLSLERSGYRTITAADGSDAIAVVVEHRDEIRCVIMDMMMPHMDGAAAIRTIRRISPDARVIATSGLPPRGTLAHARDGGAHLFLPKPYSSEELLRALTGVLEG